MSVKSVTILGSTGSVGSNTLDLIGCNPGDYRVMALTAHRNVALLAEQARKFKADSAVIADESRYQELKAALNGSNIKVSAGAAALDEAAQIPTDWLMASIVGAAGLRPTLSAIRRGATVALANKECLVCAGDLMMGQVREYGATLLPVDSEHNAIFQVFDFERPESVRSITLTASGGPCLNFSQDEMMEVTPAQAVAHPNWDMGAKISVDSATMMNKGLEMIEAYHLFPLKEDQIEIIVHPQSVIHSMVNYHDGSVLAQLGSPDMRIPIAYTLGYPERIATPVKRLNLAQIRRLDFMEPDMDRFPALRLAREALRLGGTAPTILSAANEVVVFAFLKGRISFLAIAGIVEETLTQMETGPMSCIEMIHDCDARARRIAESIVEKN